MGLQMVGLLKIRLHTFSLPRNSPKGLFGAFILGILFGMASSPCATPVLVVILSYVASEKNILYGGSLLFVYALAHTALILIVGISAGLATNILRSLRIRKVSSFLHQASGVIIIFVGVLIILGIIR
ncbi:MAG: cytochrome c biogenesis protein CcdA, partial [Candidatus Margulisiibacteriota bacterium]